MYLCTGLDYDYDSDDKADKIKNPNSLQNSLQSGKWQLGFQGEET